MRTMGLTLTALAAAALSLLAMTWEPLSGLVRATTG
jgi:hypothetical protein